MAGRRTAFPRVRVYATLRSAHLERAHDLSPSSIIYRSRRYDFDTSLVAGLDLIQAGPIGTARILARSDVRELEVNEPLMVSSLRRTVLAVLVARLRAALRRRRLSVVTYAIANDDPFRPPPGPGLRGRARRRINRLLVRLAARQIDRVVFGTTAAEELYTQIVPAIGHAARTVIPAVPAPCPCLLGAAVDREPDSVLFVGAFDERKGLANLLGAWPEVVRRWPAAHLTLVGSGPLLARVQDFAARRAEVTVVVDPPRVQIHGVLRAASLVVLLSQRTPRWREQVGLPIVEGLAHGCSVVATTETGLAGWLRDHGHLVLDPAATPDDVAAAIVSLIGARRPAASVLADLPEQDGRLAADAWMFGSTDRAREGATGGARTRWAE